MKKRRPDIAAVDGRLAKARADLAVQQKTCAEDAARVAESKAAGEQLAQMPPGQVDSVLHDDGDVDRLRETGKRAEIRLKAFLAKGAADAVHTQIYYNDRAVKILAPEGLRASKLRTRLDDFNSELITLSHVAGWRSATVQPDMTLSYGTRPYPLLSASEQYRVRACLQVAMAKLDKSDIVILDAADILDGAMRRGLIDMLIVAEIPALVCMTVSREDQIPDLRKSGIGHSYVIEDGVTRLLGQ